MAAQPVVQWIVNPPSEKNHPGRAAAVEKVCKDIAILNNWAVIGIRQEVHNTVTTNLPGQARSRAETENHLTVWIGKTNPIDRDNFTLQGHIYVTVDGKGYATGLMKSEDLKLARAVKKDDTLPNPELYDRDNKPVKGFKISP